MEVWMLEIYSSSFHTQGTAANHDLCVRNQLWHLIVEKRVYLPRYVTLAETTVFPRVQSCLLPV